MPLKEEILLDKKPLVPWSSIERFYTDHLPYYKSICILSVCIFCLLSFCKVGGEDGFYDFIIMIFLFHCYNRFGFFILSL